MRNYKIITDSTCDLPSTVIRELDVHVIPMEYILDEVSHFQDIEDEGEKTASFYGSLREGKVSSTSMINTARFMDVFEPYLKADQDILHISFSSALSGSYNASRMAAEELKELYPERKILVLDSIAASIGQGLLVYHAVLKKRQGLTHEELYVWLEENKKQICHWFTVEDLMHLKRGGRISALSANIGTALNIKPILSVNMEGKLVNLGKVMGRKKSLSELIIKMKTSIETPENQVVIIGHGDSLKDAEFLSSKLKNELHVKEVIMTQIGPIIGSHTGPGMIGLTFIGDREPQQPS
ncbi:DegV family protein [Proteiniclasticum ruminis]|uniref:DegV family protein n=1 Tax=Proteiniclasticum ruminis TaxID=398199 RepID=UPI0028A76729|nr:DegV family protein [Proteiniclasticum ruminis]